MFTEETLGMVREAFGRLRQEGGLGGWGLDDAVLSPFLQESGSDSLTVSLLRGDSERASIDISYAAARRGGEMTVDSLAFEIRRELREHGLAGHIT
jgi:hypothetical protein